MGESSLLYLMLPINLTRVSNERKKIKGGKHYLLLKQRPLVRI